MSLIEQLGGYDSLKKEYEETLPMIKKGYKSKSMEVIRLLLLEHRRENNIFEVGDKVIITEKIWGEEPYDELCYLFNAENNHVVGVGIDISVGFDSSKAYRHATPEEIKVGHRL